MLMDPMNYIPKFTISKVFQKNIWILSKNPKFFVGILVKWYFGYWRTVYNF